MNLSYAHVAGPSVASSYAYDASGTRLWMDDDGIPTLFPADGYETAADGTPTRRLTAGPGGPAVATVTGTGTSAVPRYVHTDHLTGSGVVTSAAGTADELLDYTPFGGVRLDERAGSFTERRKYAGHEFDAGTQLSYMKARYYDAGIGRFLSEDPAFLDVGSAGFQERYSRPLAAHLAGPQGLNAYSYVSNNPLRYTDPEGEIAPLAIAAYAAAAYGYASLYADWIEYKTVVLDYPEVWTPEQIEQEGWNMSIGLILQAFGAGVGKAAKGLGEPAEYLGQIFMEYIGLGLDVAGGLINNENDRGESQEDLDDGARPNKSSRLQGTISPGATNMSSSPQNNYGSGTVGSSGVNSSSYYSGGSTYYTTVNVGGNDVEVMFKR